MLSAYVELQGEGKGLKNPDDAVSSIESCEIYIHSGIRNIAY